VLVFVIVTDLMVLLVKVCDVGIVVVGTVTIDDIVLRLGDVGL
jgi:hypothetical protein